MVYKSSKDNISELSFVLLRACLNKIHPPRRMKYFESLNKGRSKLKSVKDHPCKSGWVSFGLIKPHLRDFKSQITNVPKYFKRLYENGYLEKEIEVVLDSKKRENSRLLYRVKRDLRTFKKVYLLFSRDNKLEIFFTSDYFKDTRLVYEKLLEQFTTCICGSSDQLYVEYAEYLIFNKIFDEYLINPRRLEDAFGNVNKQLKPLFHSNSRKRMFILNSMLLNAYASSEIYGSEVSKDILSMLGTGLGSTKFRDQANEEALLRASTKLKKIKQEGGRKK